MVNPDENNIRNVKYYVEETSERRNIIKKTPQKEDSDDIFESASKTRFVLIDGEDKEKKYNHLNLRGKREFG